MASGGKTVIFGEEAVEQKISAKNIDIKDYIYDIAKILKADLFPKIEGVMQAHIYYARSEKSLKNDKCEWPNKKLKPEFSEPLEGERAKSASKI